MSKQSYSDKYEQVYSNYKKNQQEHVLDYFDDLKEEEKLSYLQELSSIDLEKLKNNFEVSLKSINDPNNDKFKDLRPLPKTIYEQIKDCPKEKVEEWKKVGLDAIEKNKVAVILLAGGQGTRLGSKEPKGCYNIGLKSNKSLFQIQAERIKRIETITKNSTVNWFIMTSEATNKETIEYFAKNNNFGLKNEQIHVFNQGKLPCLSREGKILLKNKNEISYSPNGNGGIYESLIKNQLLEKMRELKVEYIHLYCVDNCLVKVCDPVFIGYSITKNSKVGVKTVNKKSHDEPVGIVCLNKDNRGFVVEYSEIGAELSKKVDENNNLVYGAGNICNHFYTLDFLESLEKNNSELLNKLPVHLASKKIPYFDKEVLKLVEPSKPNGYKLEIFVFDVFPFVDLSQFSVLQGNRKEEFSPLKNGLSASSDNAITSKKAIHDQGLKFIEQNNGKVSNTKCEIEISPLISYDGEGLELVDGKTLSVDHNEGFYFDNLESMRKAFE